MGQGGKAASNIRKFNKAKIMRELAAVEARGLAESKKKVDEAVAAAQAESKAELDAASVELQKLLRTLNLEQATVKELQEMIDKVTKEVFCL